MSYEYFTVISASPGFWEKKIKSQKVKIAPFEIYNYNKDSITIWSDNIIPVQYIRNLSKEYPNEYFTIKVYGDDVLNNYVYLYKCKNGESKLMREGYEYCFSMDASVINKIGTKEKNDFIQKVARLFNEVERSAEKVHLNISTEDSWDNVDFTNEDFYISAIYRIGNLHLKAYKQGITHVKVEIESIDAGHEIKLLNELKENLHP